MQRTSYCGAKAVEHRDYPRPNTKQVRIAAEEEGQTITAYCRDAILDRAMPEPEVPDVSTLPLWLVHFLLFLTRGKIPCCIAGWLAEC